VLYLKKYGGNILGFMEQNLITGSCGYQNNIVLQTNVSLKLLLRMTRSLDVDALLKTIKFEVTIMEISVCFSWALGPLLSNFRFSLTPFTFVMACYLFLMLKKSSCSGVIH